MAEKRKFCPLTFLPVYGVEDENRYLCERGRCAWWESLEEACALLVIARLAVRMLNGSDMGEGM